MSRVLRLSALVVTVFAVTACGARNVVTYENENLKNRESVSLLQVGYEITKAAERRKWKVEKVAPGSLVATLDVNLRMVAVDIAYTTDAVSIRYKNSRGYNYDGTRIHRRANKLIAVLRKQILRRTARMKPWTTPPPGVGMAERWPPPKPSTRTPRQSVSKESSGTGFFVSTEGHILTNFHVVKGCRTAVASTSGMSSSNMIQPVGLKVRPHEPGSETIGGGKLTVVALDRQNDLALLKSAQLSSAVASFRGGRGVRAGEDIVVTGFPLQGVLSSEINVTKGSVSSLAGPGNNRGLIQISAPVQPGNSGGPVHDSSGNIVGVVVGKLDAVKTRRFSGAVPENVNFAISEWAARSFLESYGVKYEMVESNEESSTADIAEKARLYTVLIKCLN